MDVVALNRYYSWYNDGGHTEVVERKLSEELNIWYSFNRKPVMVVEYGASAIPGLHRVSGWARVLICMCLYCACV